MKWDDLQYVLAVERHRTLSKAATHLGVTHSTVGRRLRGIESHLGVRLFDRTPEGFIATEAGLDLLEVIREIEDKIFSVEHRVLGLDTALHGKLRVSTMDIFFHQFSSIFLSFTERYPGIELIVSCSPDVRSLTRREADIALRLTKSPQDYLVGRRIGEVAVAPYANHALVERAGPNATYNDYPWINWDERLNRRWIERWLQTNAPLAKTTMRVDISSLSLRMAIVSGIGAHFLSCIEGDSDPRLQRIGPIESEIHLGLWLVTMPDLAKTKRVRVFLDHFAEHIQPHQRAMRGDR